MRNREGVTKLEYTDLVIESPTQGSFADRVQLLDQYLNDHRLYSLHAYFLVLQDFEFVDVPFLEKILNFLLDGNNRLRLFVDFEDFMNIFGAISGAVKSVTSRNLPLTTVNEILNSLIDAFLPFKTTQNGLTQIIQGFSQQVNVDFYHIKDYPDQLRIFKERLIMALWDISSNIYTAEDWESNVLIDDLRKSLIKQMDYHLKYLYKAREK